MNISIQPLEEAKEFDIGIGCRARAVVWPGMGSIYRTMNYIEINASHKTKELYHPDGEAAYFIRQGTGKVVDKESGEEFEINKGKMILLDAGTRYVLEAGTGTTLVCIGGPCPPDENLYNSDCESK
ncbi:ectoine synthase [Bacillus sp. B15-48]|uniref:ectoine synthase n=1 Tax=Bacillus sp. B15-48 TaxID=1548601 RepID=UPI00193F60CB|nr:ectoine synthase [Bacillus sp. B15-48]MBM4765032.1 hypothetical protein [Bacillus sp. B15-48]